MLRNVKLRMHLGVGLVLLLLLLSTSLCPAMSEDSAPVAQQLDDISEVFTDDQRQALEKNAVSFAFQAEVSRLLDTFINSLYTQKDVFIRELISNAADALEKTRFLSVADPTYLTAFPDLEIRVAADANAKTLTIQDTGVGMTKQELIDNLGTVAQSGTTNFLEAMANGGDINLIGQFGVGFYSAFLVANKVTVTSKSNTDPDQYIWESTVNSSFTIAKDPRGPTLRRGTRITLHLRDDTTEFLDTSRLESVILKYNQFLNFPVKLLKERKVEKVPEEKSTTKDVEDNQLEMEDEDKESKKEIEYITEKYWDIVNKDKPLWLRPKEDITDAEYSAFYKSLMHTRDEPLAYTHFVGEGEVEFRSIIYIPSVQTHDAWNGYFSAKQHAIKLYARRVLVADAFYEVLPKWLNFIKGVVDSDDLPLKVDRESLAQDKVMRVITRKVVGKFFELLKTLIKNDSTALAAHKAAVKEAQEKGESKPPAPVTNYTKFWKGFQKNIQVGCIEDDANRQKIVEFLRFHTTKVGAEETISLSEYVERMPESQKHIYYISSDNFEAAMASPHVQIYKKKGYEVLILMDPVEEPCLERVMSYQSKSINSVEKANAKLDTTEDEKKQHKRVQKAYKPLTTVWYKLLKDRLSGVRVSSTLVEDPAVIVSSAYGYGAFNERVLRSQTFGGFQADRSRSRFLDINPNHPLIKKLLTLAVEDSDDPQLHQICETLYDTALLGSGYMITNPVPMTRKYYKLIQAELGIKKDAVVEDFVPPEEDENADELDAQDADADDDLANQQPPFGNMPSMEELERLLAKEKDDPFDSSTPEKKDAEPVTASTPGASGDVKDEL